MVKMKNRITKVLAVAMVLTMSIASITYASTESIKSNTTYSEYDDWDDTGEVGVDYSNAVVSDVDQSLLGTSNNGYRYNTTLSWPRSKNSVRGYYIAVQNDTTKVWVIKSTMTTNPNVTRDTVYGLKPGTYYNVYIYPLDANYKLLVEFNGMKMGINPVTYAMYNKQMLPVQ